jgi:hypothetical protein
VRADFDQFIFLLFFGKKVWLNDNIMIKARTTSINWGAHIVKIGFDDEDFLYVCCFNYSFTEAREEDTLIFDMLLESQSRRNIRTLTLDADRMSSAPSAFMFSSRAFDLFLARNEQLTVLELACIKVPDDACEIIGRTYHRLDSLQLDHCELDIQRFVDTLGSNDKGPRMVRLDHCTNLNEGDPAVIFSSVVVPLLQKRV